MKHFKLLSLLLGLCACTFCFTACGDDDDDEIVNDGEKNTTNSIRRESIEKCAYGYVESAAQGITILLTPYTREELEAMAAKDSHQSVPTVGVQLIYATDLIGEFTYYHLQYAPSVHLFVENNDDEDLFTWSCYGESLASSSSGITASSPLSITKVGDKYTISCSNAVFYNFASSNPFEGHSTSFSITCTLDQWPRMLDK